MNIALIMAGGKGSRIDKSTPKQYILVNNKPLFLYALETFLEEEGIDKIALVVNKENLLSVQKIINEKKYHKEIFIVEGGNSRQESVYNGLQFLKNVASEKDVILIHDGARPLISKKIISDNIAAIKKHKAVITVEDSVDTVLKVKDGVVELSLNREEIMHAQTPQTFYYKDILLIHEEAKRKNIVATDDASLALHFDLLPNIVKGDKQNFKVTKPEDMLLLKYYLEQR